MEIPWNSSKKNCIFQYLQKYSMEDLCRFFWGGLEQTLISSETKIYVLCVLSRSSSCYFSIFWWFLLKLSQISLSHSYGSKSVFRETSKGLKSLMRRWGPQTFFRKGPPATLDPQNPDKYVRTSGTRQKIGNKITSWENPCKKSKNEYFPHACAGVPDVCIYHFLLQIAPRDIFMLWQFVTEFSEFSGAF